MQREETARVGHGQDGVGCRYHEWQISDAKEDTIVVEDIIFIEHENVLSRRASLIQ